MVDTGIYATSAEAEIAGPQDGRLSPDDRFGIWHDGRSGTVVFDVDHQVHAELIEAFPDGEAITGAGFGPAGYGRAGYGGGAGMGAGRFAAGMGPAGYGAALMRFVTEPLRDGAWLFAVVAVDAAGNPSPPASGTQAIAILAGVPRPPASVTPSSFDSENNTVTLSIGLSPDDEGA